MQYYVARRFSKLQQVRKCLFTMSTSADQFLHAWQLLMPGVWWNRETAGGSYGRAPMADYTYIQYEAAGLGSSSPELVTE